MVSSGMQLSAAITAQMELLYPAIYKGSLYEMERSRRKMMVLMQSNCIFPMRRMWTVKNISNIVRNTIRVFLVYQPV